MADKKFSPMRYSASTEEAAINGALQIVGVSRDEIEIEVLDRSEKGVTVRIKPRTIEVPATLVAETTPEAPVEEPISAPEEVPFLPSEPALESALFVDESSEDESPETELPVAESSEENSAAEPSPIVEDVPELLAQSEPDAEPETEIEAQIGEGPDSYSAEYSESDSDEDSGTEVTENENLSEAAPVAPVAQQDPAVIERARVTAQDFLERMGLEATAQVGRATDEGTVALVIEGDDVGILIGKHGATLQSFQYLLNLTLNAHSEGEGTRVVVDAGNYRARRQSSLEQTARSAASKARRENRPVRLEPMPAHERRLVHMFLQTEADVATQSEGREPMRRIVVAPSGGGRLASTRPAARTERSYGEGRSSGGSGMGGYGRRGDGNSERNRGLQRGR